MSNVAQKQDMSDLEVIRRFANLAGDERRLNALYILTHADIRGTSPKVWNGWKGKLLEDLFFAAQRLLRGATPPAGTGHTDPPGRRTQPAALLRPAPGHRGQPVGPARHRVFPAPRSGGNRLARPHAVYRVVTDEPVVKARLSHVGEGLQVMVYMKDQRDLFMRLLLRLLQPARLLDCRRQDSHHPTWLRAGRLRVARPGPGSTLPVLITLLEHDLTERLATHTPVDRPASGRLSREVKHFPITPEISIRPDERGQHHIMSVTAADRPGLLFGVAETLAAYGINLHTAKIATLGERVEDTFLISGPGLSQDVQVLKIESDLLEKLAV